MSPESCCTCARLLSDMLVCPEKTPGRRLVCCNRIICWQCTEQNERFQRYCPFCQISMGPSSLPPEGLREPPPYSPPTSPRLHHLISKLDKPPAYATSLPFIPPKEKSGKLVEDVLHFLSPQDSILSLALAYRVPQEALRRKNCLFADHLLAARRAILIPGEYYCGPSLNPEPLESEEESSRKSKIRRFMVTSKVSE